MKIKSLITFALIFSIQFGFSQRLNPNCDKTKGKPLISGHFEGTEPFWDMEIKDNYFILHCDNTTEKDTLYLSRKQTHTETYAFHSDNIFGIIRKSSNGGCDLDITEDGNPTHEIYFCYKNITYMGCGKWAIQ